MQLNINCQITSMQNDTWLNHAICPTGPNADSERHFMWEELLGVISWWDSSCCIGGDFNVTHFPNKRYGVPRLTSATKEVSEFISDQGLMYTPLAGGSFTWSNNQDPPSLSRINRFLVSSDWEEYFSYLIQCCLPRPLSDHFLILLESEGMVKGSYYFKFENTWLKAEGFGGLVNQWWNSYQCFGAPCFVLAYISLNS
jgi:hypothetical protein